MVPINLTIVVARPGARGDFLAGWLGCLPGYVDNQWRIDIPTGRSFGLMSCFKELDSVDYGINTLDQLLSYRNYILGESSWTFAMSCHGYKIENKIRSLTNIKIVQITTSIQDKAVIDWEYIAKTYFSQERFESSLQQNQFYNVDKVNHNDTIEFIKQQTKITRTYADYNLPLACIQVSYQDLFKPGGSYYLCKQLNLDVADDYHKYWDTQLNLSTSKLSYDAFGYNWNINNYWK